MPTEKELEAAADAYLRAESGGLRADFGGRDIKVPFAYMRAKAALKAAEKVRAEATTKREEKLREALENSDMALHNLFSFFERGHTLEYIRRREGIAPVLDLNKQALQQTED